MSRNSGMLLESWSRHLAVLNKKRAMSQDSKVHFAKVMENTHRQMQEHGLYNEDAAQRAGITQWSNITRYPDTVLNMVSALYASQISDQLISVQPLDHPQGFVVALEYKYGDNRGDNVAGDVMIDQWGGFQNTNRDNRYASPVVSGEPIADSKGATVEGYLQNIPIRFDADHHMDLESLSTSTKWRMRKTGTSSYSLRKLNASGYEEGPDLLASGEPVDVNPNTGQFVFTTSAALDDSQGLRASYHQDLSSGPSRAGRVVLNLKTEPILAIPHKLRAQYVFDAGYGLAKSYGIDIEDSLIAACTSEIRQERDAKVIDLLLKQAGNTTSWTESTSDYISKRDKDEAFAAELHACTTTIFQKTARVKGNWAVVGKRGLDMLNNIGAPRFVANDLEVPNGPYFAGVLDGRLKIYCSPYINVSSYLVGYKGTEFYDSGFVLGDYLPIASTDFIMLDDFVGRKGFVSYYGTKMLNPLMYVTGVIN